MADRTLYTIELHLNGAKVWETDITSEDLPMATFQAKARLGMDQIKSVRSVFNVASEWRLVGYGEKFRTMLRDQFHYTFDGTVEVFLVNKGRA